ncbi:MAG: hypothetical protein ABIQ16_26465 [Polyangiaceae bacterium]
MSKVVFDPQMDGIADVEWLDLVARASGDGRHFFSENQLYLAYARNKVQVTRYIARRGGYGLVMIGLGLAIWIYALKVDWGTAMVLGIACTLTGVAMVGSGVVTRREPAAREPVQRWLAKWVAAKEGERLISELKLASKGAEYVPADAQCLVVVERDLLVDLLLKNGAHAELNAIIVAESGYPTALATEARRILAARPDLKVIAVHDATPEGVAMAGRLQKNHVFPLANHDVVDAGLFPADVTWLAELAPAIPAGYTQTVPVDSLSYDALLVGLRGVARGALSIHAGLEAERGHGASP